MKLRQLTKSLKITIMSFEVPLIAYLLFYAICLTTRPNIFLSQYVSILFGAAGLALGARLFWTQVRERESMN